MTSAYTINLNPNITTPVKTGYTFKSGDKGITFNIAVTEMDPTGTSAKIAFHRANGTSVEASLSGQGPTYSYTILGNEFAVPGVVVADVKFYQSTTQRVSTASFVFNVINDTLDGLGGGTAGYSDELETLRAEMEEAAEVLDDYIDAYGELKPLNPRGDYNASTTYHPCDLVSYNNANWICQAECTGQAPATGSAYWMRSTDAAASKADKVTGATAGNFAGLDASGNLTDSGENPATIEALVNVYGSKNMLPNTATAQTLGGVTYTPNADGTITANGSNSGPLTYNIGTPELIVGRQYTLTGCPKNLADGTYLDVTGISGTRDTGNGVTFTATSEMIGKAIRFRSGNAQTFNNIVIKPMLRDARIKDATYVPYAMTNQELTKNVELETLILTSDIRATRFGHVAFVSFEASQALSMTANTPYVTLPERFKPKNGIGASFSDTNTANDSKIRIRIDADGNIMSQTTFSTKNIRGSMTYITV